jgi:hypothetical protein
MCTPLISLSIIDGDPGRFGAKVKILPDSPCQQGAKAPAPDQNAPNPKIRSTGSTPAKTRFRIKPREGAPTMCGSTASPRVFVKTEFARVLYEDPQRRAAREAATPLRRLGEPEDIAGVALMLASRAGAFITGQTIIVDGGTTIAP